MGIKAGVKKAGKQIAAGVTVAITIELLQTVAEALRQAGTKLRRRMKPPTRRRRVSEIGSGGRQK